MRLFWEAGAVKKEDMVGGFSGGGLVSFHLYGIVTSRDWGIAWDFLL